MKSRKILGLAVRFLALLILFYIFYIGGSLAVSSVLPVTQPEPGLVSLNLGLLIVGIANTLLVMALIIYSRWTGWKLFLSLAFAWYGAVTFVMQIETWYFLSNITVESKLLVRLFIMGLPVAFIYIPLAVLILRKARTKSIPFTKPPISIPFTQWVWKLSIIALSYVILYWIAGYFIAWQNPELRTFYGSPGEILPFWEHTINTLKSDPGLFPFQLLRAMIWTICALPLIYGCRFSILPTAILVGLFFSIPQNLGHIMENPLLPMASVRLSHLIETA